MQEREELRALKREMKVSREGKVIRKICVWKRKEKKRKEKKRKEKKEKRERDKEEKERKRNGKKDIKRMNQAKDK
jgi:hypothetical protein